MAASQHSRPALHNAMWPGLVGKGSPGAEPFIDLDTMLDLTAQANVDGIRFDGVDLFLFDPHTSIDASDDELKRLRDKVASRGFVVGSLVAPVWPPTGGGAAMGSDEERKKFLTQVRKACVIGRKLRDLGIRKYGVIRIDSASSPGDWAADPEEQHAAHRRHVPSGVRHRRGLRRASRRRRRDLLGRHAQLEADGAAARDGRTGRRRSATRRTWRTTCSSRWATTRRRIACFPRATTGRTARTLDEAYRQVARALAALDDRFPRRAERRHREGIGLSRQDRTSLSARTIPNGKLDVVPLRGLLAA